MTFFQAGLIWNEFIQISQNVCLGVMYKNVAQIFPQPSAAVKKKSLFSLLPVFSHSRSALHRLSWFESEFYSRDQTHRRAGAGVSDISFSSSLCISCHYTLTKKQLAIHSDNLLRVRVCVSVALFLYPHLHPPPPLWWMMLVKTLLLFLYVTLLSQGKNGSGVHHNNAVMDECGCCNYMRTNR